MPPVFEFRGNRRSSGGGGGGNNSNSRDHGGRSGQGRGGGGGHGGNYRRDRDRDSHGDRGRDRRDRPRPEHQFTFRSYYTRTAERPLLTSQRERTPELVGVPSDENQTIRKFRPLEEISDSEEEPMNMSEDDEPNDADPDGGPARKKRIVDSTSGDSSKPAPAPAPAPAPKWSNPDPYTVLPPAEDNPNPGKKKDVVKMIRKAKVQAENQRLAESKARNEVVENADFIKFDMDDLSNFMPPEDAPTGPRNDRKRTHDEAMGANGQRKPREPKFYKSDGSILEKWLPVPGDSPTPWLVEDEAETVIPVNRCVDSNLSFLLYCY